MSRARNPEIIKWTAGPYDSGKRLDQLIAAIVSGCTRNTAARLIRQGSVLVNDAVKKPGYKVAAGDIVSTVAVAPQQSEQILPEPLGIDVVFKDPCFIIINKPPGMVVHPAAGNFSGTLVHGLLYHFPELGRMDQDSARPGIVHRLDKDTSGVMVVARNNEVREILSSQFKSRIVKKTYIAFVHGNPEHDEGRIIMPIYRHPVNRKKMAAGDKNHGRARYAETLWRVKERYRSLSVMECSIKTGRTHQIRVHLSSIGHPVIGDRVYGYRHPLRHCQESPELTGLLTGISRQMLHSGKIEFIHPHTGAPVSFTAPLPADMHDLHKALLRYAEKQV